MSMKNKKVLSRMNKSVPITVAVKNSYSNKGYHYIISFGFIYLESHFSRKNLVHKFNLFVKTCMLNVTY